MPRLSSPRISLFGVEIDAVDMNAAVQTILDWCAAPRTDRCRFVVTPNVDHAVMLQHHDQLVAAYRDADLVLADGFPLIVVSRLLRRPLPQRVAGSELVPQLFRRAGQLHDRPRCYLLGALPGVADRAAARIAGEWPSVQIVGTYSPPLGFERDSQECEAILQRIAQAEPDVLIVGLGAPKQELWVHRFHARLQAKVALCVGATIDFLAGEKMQAPVWMRRSGLEWIHRVASEPRRLAVRYARDAWVFPRLVLREWQANTGR